MTTARLAALAAIFALAATSAFGGECCQGNGHGYAPAAGYGGGAGLPTFSGDGQPGGFANRIGSPYYYTGQNAYGHPVAAPQAGAHGDAGFGAGAAGGGDVYSTHFGPGFHRSRQSGHYRFPYYSYRRPWYHVGPPAYAADTNLPW